MTTMMEIGAETTMGDDDRILENPADVRIDIHKGRLIADNPPPPALGVELSVVHFGMSDSLKDSDLEQ
uniref:Uncharacterized protein K0413C07.9 n=1 Tax=Oryza sativa subsp. indica TaxID=39946 RepID=C8TFM9_ORYSI|nr:hypothetical protein [Oryza sativa Indica Group]